MTAKRSIEPAAFVISGELFEGKKQILTGKKFGLLSVLGLYSEKKTRQSKWVCRCDCGFYTVTFGFGLTRGESKSCGCVAADKARSRWINPTEEMRQKHSEISSTHKLSKHPLFSVWSDMKQRCINKNNKFYFQYGGRGISVCERWLDFENFFQDMHEGYESGLQIGRIDNNGMYCNENCRWETRRQNQRNKSNTVYVNTPKGMMLLVDASEIYCLTTSCVRHRIKAGWQIDKIFLTPSKRQKK